ncbi:hypothetical protein [Azospirillum sp.]|uniref:hypothetical protein n=1 Tax=Azospirillum sp. TaxID=34012 RepID=UPI002D37BEC7|nr:hypothetical protein [Azospirillum sp.]HYD67925.1 hypothetical protein [Azospirillum sp.]
MRTLVVLGLAGLLALPGLPVAAEPVQRLFYEAVPAMSEARGPEATAPEAGALDKAPFAVRSAFAARVAGELVPAVLRALGHDPAAAVTELTVGGWQLRTNPSLHTALPLADAEADRLAAALGFVLRQDSVLVADLTQGDGRTGSVIVTLPRLTPDRAQRFFAHAARVDAGLGGGYTAFGDAMLFLNVAGDDGKPYSGLPDAAFADALARAARRFPAARLTATGLADARFVSNDWAAAPDGADYTRRLDPATVAALRTLRDRHAALLRAANR